MLSIQDSLGRTSSAASFSPGPEYDQPSVNFDALAAELLVGPLDEFTPRRNAKAKELKAAGQADLARQLSGLKKPSLPLWAVNQLAVRDRATLGRLRDAAHAVAKVQAAAAAGRPNAARDLRAALEEFRRELEATGKVAAAALSESRRPAGQEALLRIHEILRLAALQGGETWRRLGQGAMVSEPRAGDDMAAVFGAGSGPTADRQRERAEARRALERAQTAAQEDAEQAQRALATAQRLRQEATEMAAAAKRAAERAKAAEDEAARAKKQAKKSQGARQQPRRSVS
jgi:hypothetical protein